MDENVSKAQSILQVLTSAPSGTIYVESTAGYVAYFEVDYDLGGQTFKKFSSEFTAGMTEAIDIPESAENIIVNIFDAVFIKCWTLIVKLKFDAPVTKKYHIWGSTLLPSYEEVVVQA